VREVIDGEIFAETIGAAVVEDATFVDAGKIVDEAALGYSK
jgi:hypothetical protein